MFEFFVIIAQCMSDVLLFMATHALFIHVSVLSVVLSVCIFNSSMRDNVCKRFDLSIALLSLTVFLALLNFIYFGSFISPACILGGVLSIVAMLVPLVQRAMHPTIAKLRQANVLHFFQAFFIEEQTLDCCDDSVIELIKNEQCSFQDLACLAKTAMSEYDDLQICRDADNLTVVSVLSNPNIQKLLQQGKLDIEKLIVHWSKVGAIIDMADFVENNYITIDNLVRLVEAVMTKSDNLKAGRDASIASIRDVLSHATIQLFLKQGELDAETLISHWSKMQTIIDMAVFVESGCITVHKLLDSENSYDYVYSSC